MGIWYWGNKRNDLSSGREQIDVKKTWTQTKFWNHCTRSYYLNRKKSTWKKLNHYSLACWLESPDQIKVSFINFLLHHLQVWACEPLITGIHIVETKQRGFHGHRANHSWLEWRWNRNMTRRWQDSMSDEQQWAIEAMMIQMAWECTVDCVKRFLYKGTHI